MSDSTPVEPRVGAAGWVVAALGSLYYCQPLAVPLVDPSRQLPADLVALLLIPGAAGLVLLAWLRRAPVLVSMCLAGLWLTSPAVFGPVLVAQHHVARHRRVRSAIIVACILAGAKTAAMLLSGLDSPALVELGISITGLVIALLTGWLFRSDAETRTARQDALEAQLNEARMTERERIAREMHDVVAHRLSLIALHAGALAHRMRADRGEAGDLARAIQANAQSSLDELRAMLVHLRGSTTPPEPPQPTLSELDALLDDARSSGQRLDVTVDGELAAAPERVSRHAHRILQEALTNARKHAPGAPVVLALTSTREQLRMVVTNPLADLAPPNRSGAGFGLVGIAERVDLVGGDLSHGIVAGEFVLDVTLPYAPGGTP